MMIPGVPLATVGSVDLPVAMFGQDVVVQGEMKCRGRNVLASLQIMLAVIQRGR